MSAATSTIADPLLRLNVTDRLAEIAAAMPDAVAVACPQRWSRRYRRTRKGDSGARYATITFAELDAEATRIARGLTAWGVPPGTRLALLVRPGIEFATLVFALLRAGMVIVLIDPGLGRRNLIRCLAEAEPEGFVAIPVAQAARLWLRKKFPRARWNVTVGRRWFWGGRTLDELCRSVGWAPPTATNHVVGEPSQRMVGGAHPTQADDPAAIIFTSGSTGPPKGVFYTHRMFDTQVVEIQRTYNIEPGDVDLACFPLFALFNAAMGVTTVLPDMDFSRPASADARKVVAAANDWQVTQAFASPAVWRVVSEHCAKTGDRMPTLRQVFSCGAPVPADILRATLACVATGAKMHTPYGATECLPVATIEAAEVLNETAARTNEGAGVCVGRKFDTVEWRIIRITDEPIPLIDDTEELPPGEIGELIVRGPQTSPLYVTRRETNAQAKISDGDSVWHRMGDVGYVDEDGRFWYCGRKSQRVDTPHRTLFTECIEAMFNQHPHVKRSALVGVGPKGGQTPVLVVETTWELYEIGDTWWSHPEYLRLINELKSLAGQRDSTKSISQFLLHISLPMDVRHNSKINRETLAKWAAEELAGIN